MRSSLAKLTGSVTLLVGLWFSSVAQAALPTCGWIQVEIVGEDPLADDILQDLRARLRRADDIGIDVVRTGDRCPPLAFIRIEVFPEGKAVIDIHDVVTHEHIKHPFDYGTEHEDTHSLFIVETTLDVLKVLQGGPPPPPPPPQPRPPPPPPPPPPPGGGGGGGGPPPPPPRVGHRVAVGMFGSWTPIGGLGGLGPSVIYEVRPATHLGLSVGARGFVLLPSKVPEGTLLAGGALLELGVHVPLALDEQFDVEIGGIVAAGSVGGRGAWPGGSDTTQSDLLEARGELNASVYFAKQFRLELPLAVGGVIHGIRPFGEVQPFEEVRPFMPGQNSYSNVQVSIALRVAWTTWAY